jgi:glycosyltransferase involved in cell wall biosynthesis
MDNPLVSVVLPTYNRAHLLPRAINSVLNQTYKSLELIIIDDGSTDKTDEVVGEYKKKDTRIKYLKNTRNSGAPISRNRGIRAAKGKFIAFQDSDDEWLPSKIDIELKLIQTDTNLGLVYSLPVRSGAQTLLSHLVHQPPRLFKGITLTNKLLETNFIYIHILARKECVINVGMFDIDLLRFQDWDLWIRLSQITYFACTNQTLFIPHYSDQGISAGIWKNYILATELILKKYKSLFANNQRALAKRLLLLGDSYLRNNQVEKGLNLINESINRSASLKAILVKIALYILDYKLYLSASKRFIRYIR